MSYSLSSEVSGVYGKIIHIHPGVHPGVWCCGGMISYSLKTQGQMQMTTALLGFPVGLCT